MKPATHRCPGCHKADVPNTQLGCRPCWYALSKPVRDAVWATVKLPTLHPDRLNALESALEEWQDNRDRGHA
jgi:hypothetical protein